jgi:hypothetical protein
MDRRLAGTIVLGVVMSVAACSGNGETSVTLSPQPSAPTSPTSSEEPDAAVEPTSSQRPDSTPATPAPVDAAAAGEIVVDVDQVVGRFDRRLLGTNVPAWLGPERLGDPAWVERTRALGAPVLRFPGGSWSSTYDWLGCENGDAATCVRTWGARPTDAAGFLRATGAEGTWTVSFNATAQEAAALVAFFNGSVDDTTVIGVDRRGRDWKTVGDWARLRADHGNPDPVRIQYWEIGNEVYGATADAQGDCADFGWEKVWTCDGADYVHGDDEHDGFLGFRDAMLAVDPEIEVGAVGVPDPDAWGDWGNEVIGGAGDAIDFYIVHHYGFNRAPSPDEALAEPSDSWPGIMAAVDGALASGAGDEVEVAVTEYNLVPFLDADGGPLMTTALNAFYLAETIGQLASYGVDMANQWNLANGKAENGSDYGLVDAETTEPYPAYYALALWSRFEGTELLAADTSLPLGVYAGRTADGGVDVFVSNATGDDVGAALVVDGGPWVVTADVVEMPSLDASEATFNGTAEPSDDLSEPSVDLGSIDGPIEHTFASLSLTVLHLIPPA